MPRTKRKSKAFLKPTPLMLLAIAAIFAIAIPFISMTVGYAVSRGLAKQAVSSQK